MNTHLINVLSHPLIERLGWTLVHSLWQGGVIAVLLFVILTLLRRAAHRHAACGSALLIMLVCSGITFRSVAVSETEPVQAGMSPVAVAPSVPWWDGQTAKVPALHAVEMKSADHPWIVAVRPYLPWMAGVWMLGVVLLSAKQLFAWSRLRRWRAVHCQSAGEELNELLLRLRQRLGVRRLVRLLECARASTPMLLGWLRPVIILPSSIMVGLSREQLEAVLAHELAHLRCGDALFLCFQRLMETLYFFHPAVWWMGRRLHIEREHRCDDVAVDGGTTRENLAAALGRLALSNESSSVIHGLAATGHMPVLDRMRRLLNPSVKAGHSRFEPFAMFSTVAAVTTLALIMVNCHKPQATVVPPAAPVGSATPVPSAKSRFVASGKLIIQWPSDKSIGILDPEARADFRATQIEILESGELRRRALDRVRALHPEIKEVAVETHATRVRDSSIIDVAVSGEEPKYTRLYTDALLDEFMAFRQYMLEKSVGSAMNKVIEEVLSREKNLKVKQEELLMAKRDLAQREAAHSPDLESAKASCDTAETNAKQAREDFESWKKTLDKLEASRITNVELVSVFERPSQAVKMP